MVLHAGNGRRQTRLHTLQHRTLRVRGKEPGARRAEVRDGVTGEQVRYHVCARGGWNEVLAGYEGPIHGSTWEIGTCLHAEGRITDSFPDPNCMPGSQPSTVVQATPYLRNNSY